MMTFDTSRIRLRELIRMIVFKYLMRWATTEPHHGEYETLNILFSNNPSSYVENILSGQGVTDCALL